MKALSTEIDSDKDFRLTASLSNANPHCKDI